MSVYRFKIYFEDDESVYREIEIKAAQTFEDFHKIIQKAINFDDAHPAAFFISNDTWRRGKEIRLLRNKKTDTQKDTWMHQLKITVYVEDPHQKIIYEFDPEGGNWNLYIELVKILSDSPITYPRIAKSVGNPPPQYKITTPVEVPEEDGEEPEVEEDNYVKGMPEHYVENEDDEMEKEISTHVKSEADTVEDDEQTMAEEGTEGFEDSTDAAEDEDL